MARPDRIVDVERLVAEIPAGSSIAVPAEYGGVAMALTRSLLQRGTGGLRLIGCPTTGLQADLLIGAGQVAEIESAAVMLGELGPAPRFRAAATAGTIFIKDATCPAIHSGLQAAEKGIPFLPIRGIIGSDLLRHRPDWRVIDNPYASGDPIVLVPAIQPDFAVFHAPLADRRGNVWIGLRRELMTLAHAARRTLVTVEEIVESDLLEDERMAPGTIAHVYIGAVAKAEKGAWPLPLPGRYGPDEGHLRLYADWARTDDGFRRYLDRFVLARAAAE